jgi:hypothetical protein
MRHSLPLKFNGNENDRFIEPPWVSPKWVNLRLVAVSMHTIIDVLIFTINEGYEGNPS